MIDLDNTLFLMMRHGHTPANDERLYRSWSNAPKAQLDDEGQSDAREAGEWLLAHKIPIGIIVCDSLDRTMEAAEILGDTIGVDQIVAMRGLHPLHMGDWTLMSKDEHPVDELIKDQNKRIPGGETKKEFNNRQMATYQKIFKLAGEYQDEKVITVGHGSNTSFLHNHVFNEGDEKTGYEGLVEPGGLIAATKGGLVPLTKIRGNEDEKESKERHGRFLADDPKIAYCELQGAVKDADCKKVFVEGGVSKDRGCCNIVEPVDGATKFSCGLCTYLIA
jgi:broad specificity phosphatase PhoE